MTTSKNRSTTGPRRSVTRQNLRLESLESRMLMAAAILDSANVGHTHMSPSAIISAGTANMNQNVTAFIVNGQQTSDYKSVGIVNGGCTGTLISPTHVLTAAHCVENESGGYIGNREGTFLVNGQTYRTVKVTPHPRYNPNNFGAGFDLAIMELDRPVVGVAPSEINRTTPRVGQVLTLVGFGEAGTSSRPSHGFGVKYVGTTPIDSISNEHISWTIDNANEASTAPGDSGGPAFINVGGKQVVAGVTSGGSEDAHSIGSTSFDTRVDTLASWIDSIVGAVSSQATVSVRALDSSAAETNPGQPVNTGSFQISRTGPTTSPLIVSLSMGGTATNGIDYSRIPTSVTIPAGASSTVVTLSPIDDSLAESSESALLTLSAQSGYRIDDALKSATVTIADNDANRSNDLFANRQRINGVAANVTGSNVNATREAGEPNIEGVSGGKSVWWTWTASANGRVTLSTAGSSFDTTLGVYTGNAVNSVRRVASNDDNPQASDFSSQLSFNAVAGKTYQIAVDGYEGARGSIKLSLNQSAANPLASSLTPNRTTSSFGRSVQNSQSDRDEFFERLGLHNPDRTNRGSSDNRTAWQVDRLAAIQTGDSATESTDTVFDGCLWELLDDEPVTA